MDDDDFNFDFEDTLQQQLEAQAAEEAEQERAAATLQASASQPSATADPAAVAAAVAAQSKYGRNYRQTVCTYWLKGLCALGDACGFLHQYDKERMPVCRTLIKFGECKEPDCPYKHSIEDVKECNMYKLGFCIYGHLCRYRHLPAPGPPPDPSTVESAKPREYRHPAAEGGRGRGRFGGRGEGRGRSFGRGAPRPPKEMPYLGFDNPTTAGEDGNALVLTGQSQGMMSQGMMSHPMMGAGMMLPGYHAGGLMMPGQQGFQRFGY